MQLRYLTRKHVEVDALDKHNVLERSGVDGKNPELKKEENFVSKNQKFKKMINCFGF